jgi:hypothetical protein
MTISAWVNATSNANYDPIVSKGGTQEFEIAADLRAGDFNALSWRSTSSGTGTNFNNFFTGFIGTWVHVVVVVSGTNATAYRNGVSQGTVSIGSRSNSSLDVFIGKRSGAAFYFQGSIDDVRIWNRALSSSEVTALYNEY